MQVDLHTHTNRSDGHLSPQQLMACAVDAGVEVLSITDHDTVAAYDEVRLRTPASLTLIPGVEISTYWQQIGVHIVALNFSLDDGAIRAALRAQQGARHRRAEEIADKIHKLGMGDSMARVQILAAGAQIGRPHFAQYLVEIGRAKSMAQAFKKYLGEGKCCAVRIRAADIRTVIEWIRDAGGTAVLAHPLKYGLTRTKLTALIDDFKSAGGHALEVVSGHQTSEVTRDMGVLCTSKGLRASCGSDFHQLEQSWAALGRFPALPADCTPVWEGW